MRNFKRIDILIIYIYEFEKKYSINNMQKLMQLKQPHKLSLRGKCSGRLTMQNVRVSENNNNKQLNKNKLTLKYFHLVLGYSRKPALGVVENGIDGIEQPLNSC